MLSSFGVLNTLVLVIYLGSMILIGLRFAGQQKTTEDYFLAGRNMPWLAVGMSMFASLTSAMTFMGVPSFAYRNNIAILFGVAMSLVAAPILAYLFYPHYRKLRVTTSYEYIQARFGGGARFVVSLLFVLGRLGWLGVVIYAPAKAMSVATGMSLLLAIGLMGLLAVTYTVLGGLSAVIWTDVIQFVILVSGAIWLVVSLTQHVPGGVTEIMNIAKDAGKFDVFDWTDVTKLTALSAMVGWFFVFLNDYGTDQVTVQRLMAVRKDRGVVKAIAFNAFNDLFINGMLLFIGIGIFAYFQTFPEKITEDVGGDGMLPYYIMHILPSGISGLLITAIFAAAMSSVDSGINSVATVIINDLITPLRKNKNHFLRSYLPNFLTSFTSDLILARILTILLGIFATITAIYAAQLDSIVEIWMKIMGLFAAPILGIFVLGMFSKRANFYGWLCGALCAIALTAYFQHFQIENLMPVWHFPIAFVVTTTIGYCMSYVFPSPS